MVGFKSTMCDLLAPSFTLGPLRILKSVFKERNYDLPVSSTTPLTLKYKKDLRPLSFKTKRLLQLMYEEDQVLYTHSTNLATHAYNFGKLIRLDKKNLNLLYTGALLHDIGKIYYKEILDLPRKLSLEERKKIEDHVLASYLILSSNDYDRIILLIALLHHSGSNGYPVLNQEHINNEVNRVSKEMGTQISKEGVIDVTNITKKERLIIGVICILDIFEAMIDVNRPYKEGVSLLKVLSFYDKGWGTQYLSKLKKPLRKYIKTLTKFSIAQVDDLSASEHHALSL